MFDAEQIETLSPELQRAARWIEGHPDEVALQSMRECARRAGLAPSTFTRLAHALDHAGFDALKLQCQQQLAGYASRARVLQRRSGDWLETLNQTQHANTASIAGLNPRARVEAVADAMLAAPRVHFLGLRASHGLAFHLHYTYALLAPNGVLLQDLGGTLLDQLDRIARTDLLVAISLAPYTRQTVEAVEQVAGRGIGVVAITDSAHSPLARAARHTLLFRADSPSYFQSMVGGLALAEALAAAVTVRGGRRVLAHLQSAQRRLDERGAYVERRVRKGS
jgi:DNA-binding MurR/RpiR family transcriptional regulator